MPSLRQLLANHGHLLVVDAASTAVQVGVLAADASRWQRPEGESGRAIFDGTAAALRAAGIGLADVGGFVFCEGPGSMLGIRTAAMALRTWQVLQTRPAYAYQSLAIAAVMEFQRRGHGDFTVLADARRESWHALTVDPAGQPGPLRRLASADLPVGDWVTPEGFRAWSELPRPARACSYDLAAIFAALGDRECFHECPAPDAFQHEAPTYQKWTAQLHSAETAERSPRPERARAAPPP